MTVRPERTNQGVRPWGLREVGHGLIRGAPSRDFPLGARLCFVSERTAIEWALERGMEVLPAITDADREAAGQLTILV